MQVRDIFCWIRFWNCIFLLILQPLYGGGKRSISRLISTFHKDLAVYNLKQNEVWNKTVEVRNTFGETSVNEKNPNYVYNSHLECLTTPQHQNRSANTFSFSLERKVIFFIILMLKPVHLHLITRHGLPHFKDAQRKGKVTCLKLNINHYPILELDSSVLFYLIGYLNYHTFHY